MACCGKNGAQAINGTVFGASAPISPIVRTGRQYVSGASGFDSPFDTPSPVLTAIPRTVAVTQERFPVMIIVIAAFVLYLYLQRRR